MRVLVAFDKFKDSLTAGQACALAAEALRAEQPGWQLDLCPLADGGEGFAEILTQSVKGEFQAFPVTGPRGGSVTASLGLVRLDQIPAAARALLHLQLPGSARIAIVEMAAASGLALLSQEARDPWQATSLGTGQLIHAAATLGANAVLLGVGGSATNDLGLGALSALGFTFLAADGRRLDPPIPAVWPQLARIAGGAASTLLPIRIACDVSNPLLGPRGATAIFGPQKGLAPADFARLEGEAARMAGLLSAHCGQSPDLAHAPGAGAAGGIAFGLMTGTAAQLLPGADLVASWLDLEARLSGADLVITGEGSFDASSWGGKGPGAVVGRALALGKPAHVFAGRVDTARVEPGVALHGITPAGTPLPAALRGASANLLASIRRAFAGVSGPGPSGG